MSATQQPTVRRSRVLLLLIPLVALVLMAADEAEAAGVARDRIVIDPGIGFGKTPAQSRYIIRHLHEFNSLGYPVLLGASRKSFIGKTLGLEVDDRLEASLAVTAMAVMNGAQIIRVHDVKESRRVIDMTWAIMQEKGHDGRARVVQ